ncbi:eCIS core domain-containing protein [Roseateles chitosanitabidus]|uniref:eCIS core domain-containing protein n=1 Tax=Roseateles chitosanitabidus TaxID=65048 RepID=UPI00082EF62B|nr:DUF4157 domain-containing protein [Roseateles chitosanitabidus]
MKQHDTRRREAAQAATRQPAASEHAGPGADAPADSTRMAGQAAQLERLRGAEPSAAAAPIADPGGLPAQLRAGMEAMSGMDLGDVLVHYGSSKPAQLNALAYAQGRDIHLAPGQEQHLPHEAWHVVQQAQGRVKATTTMGDDVPVNDHDHLEREADAMGAKAATGAPVQRKGRIDTASIGDEQERAKVELAIKALKEEKRQQKQTRTAAWAGEETPMLDDGKPDQQAAFDRDDKYNADIEALRATHEQAIAALAKEHELPLISGAEYYGTRVGDSKVFRRPDNGKEYVKDHRGTFVPRYIRRERNARDKVGKTLLGKGKTYHRLKTDDEVTLPDAAEHGAPQAADQISWPHREFLQQSSGGGKTPYAFSHTSTKRPILSNTHHSFGGQNPKKPEETHKGAHITDLAHLDTEAIGAQWQLDPEHGHKVRLDTAKHSPLSKGDGEELAKESRKVQMSGYRNMEVVTREIPADAVIDPGIEGWDTLEGPTSDYHTGAHAGTSKRGQEFSRWRDARSKANHEADLEEKARKAKETESTSK